MSLNSAQYEAVAHKEGPCLVLAGPGSGKTLTIAKRIEYLIKKYKVRPEEILVVTFTKFAANEMRSRFRYIMQSEEAPVTFGTFHGIYYGILKWAYGIGQENLLTEEERYQLLRGLLSTEETGASLSEEEKEEIKELSEEIGAVKNNGLNVDTYESKRYETQRFRKLYHAYEQAKKSHRKIDFEDMLVLCKQLFWNRPDILEKWQRKYRYILVDEFQDINQVQYDVIRLLAAPDNNLFVVGDDDQSVYGFRGAKPEIMLQFGKDYPHARRIVLAINYRSTAYIVNGALRVIAHNKKRYTKDIHPYHKSGETIHVQEVKNPLEESRYVIAGIKEAVNGGIPYSRIAVLYRTAPDAQMLAESLLEYQIPFHMKEHIENLYEHFIGRDMSSYFRLITGGRERRDFLQVSNRPNRYIGRESMRDGEVSFESLRNFYCEKGWMLDRIDQMEWEIKMLKNQPPYAAIQYIRKSIGYDEFLQEYAQYRQIAAEELFDTMEEIQERAKGFSTIEEWLEHVAGYGEMLKQQRRVRQETREGVALMTMHGAKGLEYDTVFIIQGNEGVIPYKKAQSEEETEEERRLFYVAMTRAKRRLVISYVKEKNGKDVTPSRFVNELISK